MSVTGNENTDPMRICKPHHVFTLLLLTATSVGAGQAYTWTDSEGVRHFSESLPEGLAQGAERVDLPPAPVTPTLPPDRYESISNQAARMEAARLKREQQREKRRQIEAKRQQARAQTEYEEYDSSSSSYPYYPYWYGPYRGRHDHHRDHRPRHRHHPPPRPRFKAGKTITQKQNAEALRNHHYRW